MQYFNDNVLLNYEIILGFLVHQTEESVPWYVSFHSGFFVHLAQ
jgi:hypothetical protein